MKTINTYILSKIKNETNITEKLKISKTPTYTLFPNDKKELQKMIEKEIKRNGNECNLNHIDTSKITNMSELFFYRPLRNFNGDISQWDVSNVKNMHGMFANSEFNNDSICYWDVSNVTNMGFMFYNTRFNGDLSGWDVSNVVTMKQMFYMSIFNGDIFDWDVSKVTNMQWMFENSKFNKDISNWKINPNCDTLEMFNFCPIEDKYKPEQLK